MSESISRSIEVGVSPGRAWRAFLNVGELLNWLCDGAVVGEKTGGRWAVGWYVDDVTDLGATTIGTIGDVVAGQSIVIEDVTFEAPGAPTIGPMQLEFLFEGRGEELTLITVRQSGLGDEPEFAAHRRAFIEGWDHYLAALKSWLETGVSPRR